MPQTFLFPTSKNLGMVAGIAASALCTFAVPPIGKKYQYFLRCTSSGGSLLTVNQMINDISKVTVRVNGEPRIEASAQELLMMQKEFGDCDNVGNVVGVLPLFLSARDIMASWKHRSTLGWGMQGVNAMTLEIQCSSGLATLANCQIFEISSDEVQPIGTYLAVRQFPHSFAATGDQDISDLVNNQPDMAYKGLFIQIPGSSTIAKVTVKVNNTLIYDQIPPEINQIWNGWGKHIEQSGYYFVDFSKIDDLQGMVPMKGITDFRLTITWATAAPNQYNVLALLYKGLSQ